MNAMFANGTVSALVLYLSATLLSCTEIMNFVTAWKTESNSWNGTGIGVGEGDGRILKIWARSYRRHLHYIRNIKYSDRCHPPHNTWVGSIHTSLSAKANASSPASIMCQRTACNEPSSFLRCSAAIPLDYSTCHSSLISVLLQQKKALNYSYKPVFYCLKVNRHNATTNKSIPRTLSISIHMSTTIKAII